MSYRKLKSRKFVLGLVLILFLFVFSFGLFAPRKAQAQIPGIVHDPISYAYQIGKGFWDTTWQVTKSIVFQTLFNFIYNYLQSLTYQTAMNLVQDMWGVEDAVRTETWGTMLDKSSRHAIGQFLTDISEKLETLTNFNICSPAIPEDLLKIQLGLRKQFGPPEEPTCDWAMMKKNWVEFYEKATSVEFLKEIGRNVFNPNTSQTGLSVAWDLGVAARDKIDYAEYLKTKEREEDPVIKGVKRSISGEIETPGAFMKSEVEAFQKNLTKKEQKEAGIEALYFNSEYIATAGVGLAATFFNTLLSENLSRSMEKLMAFLAPSQSTGEEAFPSLGDEEAGGVAPGRKAVELALKDLAIPAVFTSTRYDPVSEFSMCPPRGRGLNNCVIDQSFSQAILNPGAPLTVREAIDKGLLHGDWILVSSSDAAKNQSKECASRAYCVSNFKKLRKARIIPIGWELAAEMSPSGDELKLKDIVDSFYTCDPLTGGPTKEHPCKLIDPNWVLKAPPAQCRAKGYSQILETPDGSNRAEFCADIENCLLEDKVGNCVGGWGYCVREKNIWRINGTECPAHFNTCQTFADSSNKQISYLKNTLDFDGCNVDNAGCRQYSISMQKDAAGSWQWQTGQGNELYLNRKAGVCADKEAGCGEFIQILADGRQEKVYFKAPPSYLNCTGEENEAKECANYAGICLEKEVGCEKYTPVNGDPWVPAIASLEDYCPKECDGYAAWKQEKTFFEQNPPAGFLYFIPKLSTFCARAEVGCDEFTNIKTEGKEFFSYLRPCESDETLGAIYYTWEGSDTAGYQLKSWKLKQITTPIGSDTVGGGPDYVTGTDAALCTKQIFDLPPYDLNYNPDCREFYNASGNVFYRLYPKTIVISDKCVDYRKTESASQTECESSYGKWENSQCFYKAYGPESTSCSAKANGCRAYTGPTSANLQIIMQDSFESGTTDGWTGSAAPSNESLQNKGHSLKIEAGYAAKKVGPNSTLAVPIRQGGTYVLSFWLKGVSSGDKMGVSLSDPVISNASAAELSQLNYIFISQEPVRQDWQLFNLGPLNINWQPSANTLLQIAITGTHQAYLDNIVLKEVSDYVYLVKNSWKIPESCDRTLDGALLPQAMLGCQEYKDRKNESHFLKSFSNLCREKAIGCQKWTDTQGTELPGIDVWQAACPNATTNSNVSVATPCDYNNDGSPECTIAPGKSKCYFNLKNWACDPSKGPCSMRFDGTYAFPTSYKDAETVEVPADKNVYYVDDPTKSCRREDFGCSQLGLAELNAASAPKFSTAYLKNNPNDYLAILCKDEELGCDEFKSDKGNFYFKNPVGKTCEYKENASVGGVNKSGWFEKGKDNACYSGYEMGGNYYGIWRNGDPEFISGGAKAGECPQKESGCTEFIDPADTSLNSAGQPYHYLDNKDLAALKAECLEQASLKEGCVLMRDTNNPGLSYNASVTYAQSRAKNDEKVRPIDCADATNAGLCSSASNDANIIIKVTRDRRCGQWLSCTSSYKAWDASTGQTKQICTELGVRSCLKPSPAGGCLEWAPKELDEKLILAKYVSRDTSWSGMEYSGYSIPGLRPIGRTTQAKDSAGAERLLVEPGQTVPTQDSPHVICRSYPDKDSPFPDSVGDWQTVGGENKLVSKDQNFSRAEICEQGQNCECSYQKANYGGVVSKYFSFKGAFLPAGVCSGGTRDGLSCQPAQKDSCGPSEAGGRCVPLKEQSSYMGWQGYCLEEDKSIPINASRTEHACLTWLPIDLVGGARDIFNYAPKAGYVTQQNQYYCLLSEERKLKPIGAASCQPKDSRVDPNFDCSSLNYSTTGKCEGPDGSYSCVAVSSFTGGYGFTSCKNIATYCRGFDTPSVCGGEVKGICLWVADPAFPYVWYDIGGKAARWDGINQLPPSGVTSNTTGEGQYELKMSPGLSTPLTPPVFRYQIKSITIKLLSAGSWHDWPGREGDPWDSTFVLAPENNWEAGWCSKIIYPDCPFAQDYEGADPRNKRYSGGGYFYGKGVYDKFREIFIDSTLCDEGTNNNNSFGFKAVFNGTTGQFLHITAGLCDGSPGDGAIKFEVQFDPLPACLILASVNSGEDNKAFTDVIYRPPLLTPNYAVRYTPAALTEYHGNLWKKPYGQVAPPAGYSVNEPTQWILVEGAQDSAGPTINNAPLEVRKSEPYATGGWPYACQEGGGDAIANSVARSCPDSHLLYQATGTDRDQFTQGGTSLNTSIFAKIYKGWQWDKINNKYQENVNISSDMSGYAGISLLPAFGSSYQPQSPVISGVALNGKDSGKFFGKGSFTTKLSFYAYNPNGNQMPIRKLEVNWNGYGSSTDSWYLTLNGRFRNHYPKGGCDSSNFGKTPEACEENPWEFEHTYFYDSSCLNRVQIGGKYRCRFAPIITAEDNWEQSKAALFGPIGQWVIEVEEP